MRISGYGEFQQMRKLVQKDDATQKEKVEREEKDGAEVAASADSVLISPETRRKMKLRQASDFREAKVADVKTRFEAGTLVTPDSLKNGVSKMLNQLASGEL